MISSLNNKQPQFGKQPLTRSLEHYGQGKQVLVRSVDSLSQSNVPKPKKRNSWNILRANPTRKLRRRSTVYSNLNQETSKLQLSSQTLPVQTDPLEHPNHRMADALDALESSNKNKKALNSSREDMDPFLQQPFLKKRHTWAGFPVSRSFTFPKLPTRKSFSPNSLTTGEKEKHFDPIPRKSPETGITKRFSWPLLSRPVLEPEQKTKRRHTLSFMPFKDESLATVSETGSGKLRKKPKHVSHRVNDKHYKC